MLNKLQFVPASKGIVASELNLLTEAVCKPKILPIKSAALEQLENLEEQMTKSQKVTGSSLKTSKMTGKSTAK